MPFRYAVLGSGRQGTAAAYDLARWGDAELIVLGDRDPGQAETAAGRVNGLAGRPVAYPAAIDVTDEDALVRLLTGAGVQVFVSGVPYFLNLALARAAIRAHAGMCDFGGHTELVRRQLALDREARAAGIVLVPDCGQVPGLGTSLCAYALTRFDEPRELLMYDGGLPQHPAPPWHYALTFSIEGLTNEYFGRAVFLREGRRVEIPCFTEYEILDLPGVGRLEAFTTAGGTSTMPYTYEGRLQTLWNKTLRWPGHHAQWKAFRDAGLLDLEPVGVDGRPVVPRQLLHAVLDPRLRAAPGTPDLVILHVIARGLKDGREAEATLDLIDFYDPATGFTAMERTTGWHAAIMAGAIAREWIRPGAVPVELALPADRFVAELEKRGFELKVSWRDDI